MIGAVCGDERCVSGGPETETRGHRNYLSDILYMARLMIANDFYSDFNCMYYNIVLLDAINTVFIF